MRITQIHGTHLEVTGPIKQYVENRLSHVSKVVGKFEPCDMKVELEKTVPAQKKGVIYSCKLNLVLPGEHLRAESDKEVLYDAIDEAVHKMVRQAKKYKEKRG